MCFWITLDYLKVIPHNKGGRLASEFSFRCACIFRRLTGDKDLCINYSYIMLV